MTLSPNERREAEWIKITDLLVRWSIAPQSAKRDTMMKKLSDRLTKTF